MKKRLFSKDQYNEDGNKLIMEIEKILIPFFKKNLKLYDRHDLELLVVKQSNFISAIQKLRLERK
jgi:hypothetical protein